MYWLFSWWYLSIAGWEELNVKMVAVGMDGVLCTICVYVAANGKEMTVANVSFED